MSKQTITTISKALLYSVTLLNSKPEDSQFSKVSLPASFYITEENNSLQ